MINLLYIFFISITSVSFSANIEKIRKDAKNRPSIIQNKTASELVSDFLLDSGVSEGWNEKGKFFVAIGNSYFEDKDISKNPNFLKIRALKSFEANITAKGQIISYIRTNISTEDIISIPNTGLSTSFDKKKDKIKNKFKTKIEKYEKALLIYDENLKSKLSNFFSKFNFSFVINEPLSNIISSINITYNPNKNNNTKLLKNAEKELLDLEDDIKELKKEASILQKQLQQENISIIETFSSMPLRGAFQVAHFESFINGQYEVASILVWSAKNETRVSSLLNGEQIYVEPSDISFKEYIAKTNWPSVIGGRKFIDNKGQFYLIGVGTSPLLGKSSVAMRTTKANSELNAKKELAIALKGDVELSQIAKSKLQEIKNNDNTIDNQIASSFSENIYQKLKDLEIQGASRKFSKVVKHPLTKQDMFVSVFSLSVKSNRNAREIENSQKKLTMDQNQVKDTQQKKQTTNVEKNENISIKHSSKTGIKIISVDVTGIGVSKKESIKDGLLQAISQVNGITMSSESVSLIKSFETVNENQQNFSSQSSFQEKIKEKTRGVIQSWKIVGSPKKIGDLYETRLNVNISKLELSSDLKRMKFVISPVKFNPSIKDLSLIKNFSSSYNKDFRNMLVKSNRFGILDRNNSDTINKELKFIKNNNVRIEEVSKIGNKVGADYIIISNLNNLQKKQIFEKLSGETINISRIPVEINVNIIDIATTQIVFSETIVLDFYNDNLKQLSKILSNRFARKIVDTFYPARLISVEGNRLIADQGESFFNKKTKYTLNKLGKKIIDQTTGYISDRIENQIGILEFISGSDKQSTFKIKKLNKNNIKISANSGFVIRPIFEKLPSAKEIAKERIKKIKQKNKQLKDKISKDKDW